ncbi:MAG: peptide deformylase [Acidobacteriota bacterium]
MSARSVLLVGQASLRRRSAEIADVRDPEAVACRRDLEDTLAAFRRSWGFGRAIAAPQVGHGLRMTVLDLGRGPQAIVNPIVTRRSDATFTLWDDCMSFPWLFVKVRRHAALTLHYQDGDGAERLWVVEDRATAELVQHELDHLDGVLALDRAIDGAIVTRDEMRADPERYRAEVDDVIGE